VKVVDLAAPHRIVGDTNGQVRAIEAVRTKLGEFDTSGRRRPVSTDEVIRFECDTVVLAVGEKVDPDFLKASGLKAKEAGTIEVDRYTLETSRERFYAGGDLATGASNVSNAMGYGKKAARNIDKKLMGRKRFAGLFPEFEYAMEPPETPVEGGRHVPAEMPAAQRVGSYAEVSLGLTPVAAVSETSRCLRCDIRSAER
jgi:NADH-quinone oxidoreductase subunit F